MLIEEIAGGSGHILFVDDETMLVEMARLNLNQFGRRPNLRCLL